ncbi:MAG: ubiquitin-like domain-containing protein, partial [Chloroflexota bacterium]
ARLINTRAETLSGVLLSLDITLYEGDTLSMEPSTPVREGMVVQVDRARSVTLTIDGRTRVVRTLQRNPAAILEGEAVTVSDEDRVLVDGTTATLEQLPSWPVPANQIEIRRAVTVSIAVGDSTQTVRTTGETVGQALFEADVEIFVADEVTPSLDAPVTDGTTVTIQRAAPLTIIADGTNLETRTQAETVGAALADAGVALMGLDYAIPNESVTVRPSMTVRVIRVTEAIESTSDIISFDNISQGDNSLELDQVRVVQAGRNGVQRQQTRVRYENGVEVSREPTETVVVQPPQDRIVAFGTGVVVRTIDTPEGPREYWRTMRLLTTSYHPAALGGDNITATGRILTKGIVGVDPTVIPYGTELYVPGYGVGVAADTGGPRSTRLWIDLGYDDENWIPWSQYTEVYILTPVPNNIQYVLPD